MAEKTGSWQAHELAPLAEARAAVARALNQVASLSQVARATMEALAPRLEQASVGLALVEGDRLTPVWASDDRLGRAFSHRRGALWRALESAMQGVDPRAGGGQTFLVRAGERLLGAIATQALANTTYGPRGLALLRQGLSPNEVIRRLIADDPNREHRQVGIVDARGRPLRLPANPGARREQVKRWMRDMGV